MKTKKFFTKNWPIIILITLALFTRFWHLDQPAEVVFDEVHFGKFVSAYFTNEYYFDIHPPLGKMMIAGTANLLGYNPGFDFKQIGESLNAKDLFALRFLTAFFGVLLVIIIYYLLLALDLSRLGAFAGAFMVLFDNAILVESKFILVDIFLLTFGFASLLFFLRFQKSSRGKLKIFYYILTGILLGLAIGIKFTGASFLGLVLLFTFIKSFRNLEFRNTSGTAPSSAFVKVFINFNYLKFILISLGLVVIAGLTYIGIFPIHFSLLNKSGPGDAYMSAGFQKTLTGNKISADNPDQPLKFWGKFIELNKAMYNYSAGLTATHPDGSKWSDWPLMRKPIFYWVKSGEGTSASIYLVGNPIVWWSSSLAVMFALLCLTVRKKRNKLSPGIYILIVGYLANILPFVAVTRVAFLYHYLTSLVFAILILVYIAEKLYFSEDAKEAKEKRWKKEKTEEPAKIRKTYLAFYIAALGLVLLSFLVIAPITYGLFVPAKAADLYGKFTGFLH